MFERGNIQGRVAETVLAEIVLADGTTVSGHVALGPTGGLGELLNGATQFLTIRPVGGDRTYIAKSQICRLSPLQMPAKPALGTQTGDDNPAAILGVAQDAGAEDLHRAYHELIRRYHPDRFAGTDLPAEVTTYLQAMARRINAAYALLGPRKKAA